MSVRRLVLLASLAAVVFPAVGGAQQTPPRPLARRPVPFPALERRRLSFGSDLIVVERPGVPFVSVSVAVRGGGDPRRAALVARMLTGGTTTLDAARLAEAVDDLGATLGASAGPEGSVVTLGVSSENLEPALVLLADVVLRPALASAPLAELLEQMRARGEAARVRPASVAEDALLRAIYGDHRYAPAPGRGLGTPLDSGALRAEHQATYVPAHALFVVAGAIGPDEAARRLEEHFRGWSSGGRGRQRARPPGGVPAGARPPGDGAIPGTSVAATAPTGPASTALPVDAENEVVLVHVPNAGRAAVRVGHALMRGDDPDWTALGVASRLLDDRLGPVASLLDRRVEAGHYAAALETPADSVADAVARVLSEMERLGTEAVPAHELEAVRQALVGRFVLETETPQQIAALARDAALLGASLGELTGYREAVMGLDTAEVRAVAARRLRPGEAVIVVAGDAATLRASLTRFGSVRVVDVDGMPLDLADLAPRQTAPALSAAGLREGSWVYGVKWDDERIGEMIRTLSRQGPGGGADTLSLTSTMVAGGQTLRQKVTFLASSLTPLASSFSLAAPGGEVGARATVVDGRIEGSRTLAGGRVESFQAAAQPGAALGEMLEVTLWLSNLEPGAVIEIPVAQLESGQVTTIRARVLDTVTVDVPAGRFEAYRIEMESEAGLQTLHVRVEAPHVALRLETRGQPLVLELEFVSGS